MQVRRNTKAASIRRMPWVAVAALAATLASCDQADRVTALERRVATLESEVSTLRRAMGQGPQVAVAPAPQPVARPAPQPVAKPAPQPVAKPAPQPVAKPAPQPVAKPAPQPAAKPAPQPVAKPAPQPAAKPAPQPAVRPAPQPAARPATSGAPKAMGKGVCAGMAKVEKRSGGGHFYIDRCEYPGQGKPKANVTFLEAKQLCEARGARLCKDTEMERACQGTGGFPYPYGVDHEDGFCHLPMRAARSIDVGTKPQCKSMPWGVYDMVGNVAEWAVGDAGGVACGGSFWTADAEAATCRRSYCTEPNKDKWSFIGFRCCADSPPG